MPVSGIVIQIASEQRSEILAALESMPEVELEPVPAENVLVAVLDTNDFDQENRLVKSISDLEGVSSVTLSYHNFEDVTDTGSTH